jgi:large subunit ribosomal protein L10
VPKPQKIEAVKELTDRLKKADGALLAEFRGLKVQEIKELRRKLTEHGAEFRVVKNTLTRLAVKDAELDGLLPLIEGSTAITFIKGDPIEAAKGLDEISRKYPALVVKGGLVEGRILDADSAKALARVKPREQLLADLAGLLQAPMQTLAVLLTGPVRELGYVFDAYMRKRADEAPTPEPETPDPAAAEEPAPEQPAAEEPSAEQPEAEVLAAEAASETAAEEPSAEEPTAEQPQAETTEQPTEDQPQEEG